ncbi:MAG: putative DNA binding domain-containing protein [Candidatus Omnitrophica bacterium]|nr:putative DNA binding domain-containing protein [Candidatus Omnitrophota bacterium]
MEREEIIDFVLQEGEGYKIEFKESIGHIAREIVAFANASGGKIFIGITDDHKVKGVQITERMKSQIQDIARNCDPGVKVFLEVIPYKSKKVLLVNVSEGDNKPYSCKEGFFIRNGPITEKLKRDEIVTLFQKEGKVRFDKLINSKFYFGNDFDLKKIEDFLSRAKIKSDLSADDILLNLGVAEKQEGKVLFNNSGILFFAKNAKKFLESAYITCARFKGNDRSSIIDRADIYGSLIEQVEESMKFLKRNIRLGYKFTGKPAREEIQEYPLEALREAIINAVMHRDYFFTGSNIYLYIYSNRIEVINPGGLFRLKYGELGKRASRRNELIADLFFRVEFGEKMGSGITRMNRWMLDWGLEKPKIEVSENFFEITFYGPGESIIEHKETNYSAYNLKDRQIKALKHLEGKGKFALLEYIKLTSVSKATAQRDLNDLLSKKIIERKGRRSGGKYSYYIFSQK